jgi:hypothetical protein
MRPLLVVGVLCRATMVSIRTMSFTATAGVRLAVTSDPDAVNWKVRATL